MKLARELSKRQTGRTLYLLDEPTTGLHFDDVRKLLEVLHRLADLGNSVVIIEHNLDVIRNADWILDLGPEGGENGGRIVAEGRPATVATTPGSYTGEFLARYYTAEDAAEVSRQQAEEVAAAAAAAIAPKDTPPETAESTARPRKAAKKTAAKASGPRKKKTGRP
jgi:excinuclease ABC subunit A